jgi:hypothetical protein
VPRITDFCSCMYVFGCRLSLVRLCDSDFGITPVDDITIGITCAAFAYYYYYYYYYYYLVVSCCGLHWSARRQIISFYEARERQFMTLCCVSKRECLHNSKSAINEHKDWKVIQDFQISYFQNRPIQHSILCHQIT